MSEHRPFGIDPEDIDRTARAVSDGIRNTLRGLGNLIDDAGFETVWETRPGMVAAYPRRKKTAGDTGDGVWAIVIVDENGAATVNEVYATELDALRANKSNTDPQRRVRFLPYGIAVGALDTEPGAGSGANDFTEPDPEH